MRIQRGRSAEPAEVVVLVIVARCCFISVHLDLGAAFFRFGDEDEGEDDRVGHFVFFEFGEAFIFGGPTRKPTAKILSIEFGVAGVPIDIDVRNFAVAFEL